MVNVLSGSSINSCGYHVSISYTHKYSIGDTWYQQLPKIKDNPGQPRSRRPGSIQLAKVPSAYRQVMSPAAALEATRAGTSPRQTRQTPPTFRSRSSSPAPAFPSPRHSPTRLSPPPLPPTPPPPRP